jgi:Zn-dependent M28 family amino/carboxypeptidase
MSDEIEKNLCTHVESLARGIGPRSFLDLEALERAAVYIEEAFTRYGCSKVRREPFVFRGHTYFNIVCEVRGREFSEENDMYLVGAHYDTVACSPGADDNASGVAGVLEMARLAAISPWRRKVRFEAFCLEESPAFRSSRMGSMVSANALREAGVLLRGMVAMEMIGYYDDRIGTQFYPFPAFELFYPKHGAFIAFVGNLASRRFTKDVKRGFMKNSTLKVVSLNSTSMVPGVDFSDHSSFWKCGFPAFMVTDTAFYRNPNYHGTGDTPDTLDYIRAAEVVRGLHKAFLDLS